MVRYGAIHLGPKELKAAVVGLINNPGGRLIHLDVFKETLSISPRNKTVVIDWLKEREYLASKTVEGCGAVKEETFVAWTKKALKLKKLHSNDIEKKLQELNEGHIID